MNLSLHFLIYKWNNATSANRFLLSMQGGIDGGQSGPVFRKLLQRWWWQWDLSHRPCCALCSSQTLGNPSFGSTLIVGVWVLFQAALLGITWVAVTTKTSCVSDVWESCILPTWLTDPVLLQHCPCGQLAFLLSMFYWIPFSLPEISFPVDKLMFIFEAKVKCHVCWNLPWFLSVESCSLSLTFWS